MLRRLGWLFPGLPRIMDGSVIEGGGALILWLGLVGLAVSRFDRVVGAIGGGWGDRIALCTLGVTLAWLWLRFHRETAWTSPALAGPGWSGFKRNRMALMGLAMVTLLLLVALLAPFLAPFDPYLQPAFQSGGDMALRLAAPSSHHLMGTDQASRDVLSRILYGARVSLGIGLTVMVLSISLGTFLGAVGGYWGGWVDLLIMRVVDVFLAFPRIVLLIVLVAVFQPSLALIIAALSLTQWPLSARIVRGEILALKERDFAEAARALGFSRRRILFRHLLPNAMAPVIVVAALGVGNTIVLEAGLSFLGLGVQPPTPSWGSMVADGWSHLFDAWWLTTFPGLAIVLAVLAFNLVGDGLRDVADPRQRGGETP